MDLSSISIVDHHAHSLLKPATTENAAGFRRWFTESVDPEIHAHHVQHSLVFRTGVRWLAELLDCEPALDAVLAARAQQSYEVWVRRLFTDANIDIMLCDYGYQAADAYSHGELQELLPCRVEPILRVEALAESLIARHTTFVAARDAFVTSLESARRDGYVALKSIAAYRTGLAIEVVTVGEARAAFERVKAAHGNSPIRLADKPINDYLVGLALEQAERQALPVQFHTGFGDRDADLRLANPLLLRPLIERTGCPLVLLHAGWPYHRELAHLAAIYGNVWLDLSLAVPFATAGIPAMIRDILGVAPFSKVLFATDAFTMPDIFWLAARWGRWGLGRVLGEFVAEGLLQEQEAWQAAEAILGGNAVSLYGLAGPA